MTKDEFLQIATAINQMHQLNLGKYGHVAKVSSILTILRSHIEPMEDILNITIQDKPDGSYHIIWEGN